MGDHYFCIRPNATLYPDSRNYGFNFGGGSGTSVSWFNFQGSFSASSFDKNVYTVYDASAFKYVSSGTSTTPCANGTFDLVTGYSTVVRTRSGSRVPSTEAPPFVWQPDAQRCSVYKNSSAVNTYNLVIRDFDWVTIGSRCSSPSALPLL